MNLYYPFKPFLFTQRWGVFNPAYETLGFSEHNGIDAFTGKYDNQGKPISDFLVYCPVAGFSVESVTFEPNGGGNQLSLLSDTKIPIDGVLCYVRLYLCHAKKILVKKGDRPALGELLMIADNTGFSTGLHTHIGMYWLGQQKEKLDSNKATGSYNPEPFFTGEYAVDKASFTTLIKSATRYVAYLTGLK